jgi:hypothetical protein
VITVKSIFYAFEIKFENLDLASEAAGQINHFVLIEKASFLSLDSFKKIGMSHNFFSVQKLIRYLLVLSVYPSESIYCSTAYILSIDLKLCMSFSSSFLKPISITFADAILELLV